MCRVCCQSASRPQIDFTAWPRPAVFSWLQETGNIEEAELRRAFNCGIGMVICCAPEDAATLQLALNEAGEDAYIIGNL